jgi:hypothetical protein
MQISEGNVMPSLTRPNGRFYYLLGPDRSPLAYTRYQNAGTWSRIISNPDRGVWQITLDNFNALDGAKRQRASFQVTASLLGVSFSPQDLSEPTAPATITYSNTHAKFVGGITTTALASAYSASGTIKGGEQITYDIDIPPDASRVGAALTTGANAVADLDLYLFDCTGAQCALRDFATGNDADAPVGVDSPAPGKWKVVIDPFRVPDQGVTYQYKDYFLHEAFGQIETNGPRAVEPREVVTQPVTVNIKALPLGERYLEAMLFVTSEPATNTPAQKSEQSELYYPIRGILGTATLRLKPLAFHSAGK